MGMEQFVYAVQQGELPLDDTADNALEVHNLCASEVFMEHGTVFLNCPRCGASWSIYPLQTHDGNIASMDELDHGDESCLDEYIRGEQE